jgi:hypothetical protein
MRLVSDLDSWAGRGCTAVRAGRAVKAIAILILSFRQMRTSVPWAALPPVPALSASFIRHPWIRFRIEESGKKIDQHEDQTEKENAALNGRQIALAELYAQSCNPSK